MARQAFNAQLEADLGALLQRLTTLPSDVPDPQAPDPGSTLRQLALLAYLLNHCTTGPFAPFQQLKMLRPRVVDISVKYAFPEGPADPQGLTAHDEYALIKSRVAGIGGFGLRPYRGAGGSYVRLSNAEPELRNDIYLGDALPLDGATAIQWEGCGSL